MVEFATKVAGRHIFYNNSVFDVGSGKTDSDAIAPDKTALLPGETATFANYTSYSRGINGIMVDIGYPADVITIDDFEFRVGNDNDPSGWTPVTAVFIQPDLSGSGKAGESTMSPVGCVNVLGCVRRWLPHLQTIRSDDWSKTSSCREEWMSR